MSAATMHPRTAAVLDAVATDWRPSRVEARRVVRDAVQHTADDNDGLVHIADVRPHLPAWIDPHQIGATIARLSQHGYLVWTGDTRPNGGPSRNETKPAKVYRLARPIPEVTP